MLWFTSSGKERFLVVLEHRFNKGKETRRKWMIYLTSPIPAPEGKDRSGSVMFAECFCSCCVSSFTEVVVAIGVTGEIDPSGESESV